MYILVLTSIRLVLFEAIFLFEFFSLFLKLAFFTKSVILEISVLLAIFACPNSAAESFNVNLLNSLVVTSLSWSVVILFLISLTFAIYSVFLIVSVVSVVIKYQ